MRFIKLSLVAVAAALMLSALAVFPQRLCFDGGGKYTFYCGTSSSDCSEITSYGTAAVDRLTLKDICGESVELDNFDLLAFLKKYKAKIEFTEEGEDYVNYYCTADLPYSVQLYGKTINLHICVRGEKAKAGTPIIFGGY